MTSRNRPSGNIGTRVLADYEKVKIWDLSLEPGQSHPWALGTPSRTFARYLVPKYTGLRRDFVQYLSTTTGTAHTLADGTAGERQNRSSERLGFGRANSGETSPYLGDRAN